MVVLLLKIYTTFLFKKDEEYHQMSDPEKTHTMRECHMIHDLCSVAGDFEGLPEESYDIELSWLCNLSLVPRERVQFGFWISYLKCRVSNAQYFCCCCYSDLFCSLFCIANLLFGIVSEAY